MPAVDSTESVVRLDFGFVKFGQSWPNIALPVAKLGASVARRQVLATAQLSVTLSTTNNRF